MTSFAHWESTVLRCYSVALNICLLSGPVLAGISSSSNNVFIS